MVMEDSCQEKSFILFDIFQVFLKADNRIFPQDLMICMAEEPTSNYVSVHPKVCENPTFVFLLSSPDWFKQRAHFPQLSL